MKNAERELEINAMKMSPSEQENLRLQIVRLYKKGKTNAEIAELTDAKIRHVQATVKSYKEGGIGAVKQKTMGRPKGSVKLNGEQEKEIRKLIVDKTPKQMKFKFALWDRQTIAELIERLYKIKMPLSTMGYYLRKWGFTAQRPYTQNYKQKPAEVQKWMEEDYPKIKEKARKEGGEIFWSTKPECRTRAITSKDMRPKDRLQY
jgi:transposase